MNKKECGKGQKLRNWLSGCPGGVSEVSCIKVTFPLSESVFFVKEMPILIEILVIKCLSQKIMQKK